MACPEHMAESPAQPCVFCVFVFPRLLLILRVQEMGPLPHLEVKASGCSRLRPFSVWGPERPLALHL